MSATNKVTVELTLAIVTFISASFKSRRESISIRFHWTKMQFGRLRVVAYWSVEPLTYCQCTISLRLESQTLGIPTTYWGGSWYFRFKFRRMERLLQIHKMYVFQVNNFYYAFRQQNKRSSSQYLDTAPC